MRVLSTNILANHPAYAKIVASYNIILKEKGRVNNKKFYEEVILKEIPSYNMSSWYQFLRRFKTEAGIVPVHSSAPVIIGEDGQELAKTMLTNQEATQQALALALNVGNERLKQLMENPQLMSAKDAIDLLFKAMKAQDGRVRAIGTIRADNREQERFDRALSSAAYG